MPEQMWLDINNYWPSAITRRETDQVEKGGKGRKREEKGGIRTILAIGNQRSTCPGRLVCAPALPETLEIRNLAAWSSTAGERFSVKSSHGGRV
jgi:hypothetical protein